jgi:hypothetical protein
MDKQRVCDFVRLTLHAHLQQRLADILAVVLGDGDAELGQHGLIHILLPVHNRAEESLNGRQDEHAETAVTLLAGLGGRLVRPAQRDRHKHETSKETSVSGGGACASDGGPQGIMRSRLYVCSPADM